MGDDGALADAAPADGEPGAPWIARRILGASCGADVAAAKAALARDFAVVGVTEVMSGFLALLALGLLLLRAAPALLALQPCRASVARLSG